MKPVVSQIPEQSKRQMISQCKPRRKAKANWHVEDQDESDTHHHFNILHHPA
jgi:hypothetical protein